MNKNFLPALLTSSILLLLGEPIFATETKECKLPNVEYVTVTDGAAALRTDPKKTEQTIPGISNEKRAIIMRGDRLSLLKKEKSQMVDDTCYLPVSLSGNTANTDRVILNHRPYWVPGKAVDPQVKPSITQTSSNQGNQGNQGNQDSNAIEFDQYIFWCLMVGVLSYISFNVFNIFESRRAPKSQKNETEDEKNEISTKIDELLNKLVETNSSLNKLDEISQSLNKLAEISQSLNKLAETNQSANHGKPKGDQKSQQSDLQSSELKTHADALEQLVRSVEHLVISVKASIKDPHKNPDDSESAPVRVRTESYQQKRP
ncbi:MAG: hypothetical protein ACK6AD_09830 [Cyanobacteriota bacterium]